MEDSGSRAEAILKKIQPKGTMYRLRIVNQIHGDYMQAIANAETKTIDITPKFIASLDDDELAFVLAHEIAHFISRHHENKEVALETSLLQTRHALKKLDKGLEDRGSGIFTRIACAIAGGAVAGLTMGITAMQKSQKCESEADKLALQYMKTAGYDPKKALSALTKMYGGHLPDPGFWNNLIHSITSSHPLPKERARGLREDS